MFNLTCVLKNMHSSCCKVYVAFIDLLHISKLCSFLNVHFSENKTNKEFPKASKPDKLFLHVNIEM